MYSDEYRVPYSPESKSHLFEFLTALALNINKFIKQVSLLYCYWVMFYLAFECSHTQGVPTMQQFVHQQFVHQQLSKGHFL